MEYEKCLVQLDCVLDFLSEEDLKKIPKEIRNGIKEQMDKDYVWIYDTTKELKDQNLNRKTIAMLSYLNMEYLLNNEQKEFMKKIHDFNEQKNEEEKKKKYDSNELFRKEQIKEIETSQVILVPVKKDTWYTKFISFFKKIFKQK